MKKVLHVLHNETIGIDVEDAIVHVKVEDVEFCISTVHIPRLDVTSATTIILAGGAGSSR